MALLVAAERADPNSAAPLIAAARLALRLGAFDHARDVLTLAQSRATANEQAALSAVVGALDNEVQRRSALAKAKAELDAGRFDAAAGLTEEAALRAPLRADLLVGAAALHARAGDLDAARTALAQAELGAAKGKAGKTDVGNKDVGKTIAQLLKAAPALANGMPAARCRAKAEGEARAVEDAPNAAHDTHAGLAAWRRAAACAPKDERGQHALAAALQRHGRSDEAITVLQQAVSLGDVEGTSSWLLGRQLISARRFPEAVPALRVSTQKNPTRAVTYRDLGFALQQANDIGGALQSVAESLKIDSEDVAAWNLIGSLYLSQRRFVDAATAYREGAKRAPNDPMLHANLAGALLRSGKKSEALTEAKRAAELGSGAHWALAELAVPVAAAAGRPGAK
jgi:Flp pilus assembly protein TadD